jgi:hypothetical protein
LRGGDSVPATGPRLVSTGRSGTAFPNLGFGDYVDTATHEGSEPVELDKDQVVQMLRDRGEHDKANQAQQELPDKVDHEQHSDLLQRLGVDARELLGKL